MLELFKVGFWCFYHSDWLSVLLADSDLNYIKSLYNFSCDVDFAIHLELFRIRLLKL